MNNKDLSAFRKFANNRTQIKIVYRKVPFIGKVLSIGKRDGEDVFRFLVTGAPKKAKDKTHQYEGNYSLKDVTEYYETDRIEGGLRELPEAPSSEIAPEFDFSDDVGDKISAALGKFNMLGEALGVSCADLLEAGFSHVKERAISAATV